MGLIQYEHDLADRRPTEVAGDNGLEDWLVMFGGAMNLTAEQRREIARRLRGSMYRYGNWILDYRRLRVVAIRRAP